MGGKKYFVDLSEEDRQTLEWFISTGERRAQDNSAHFEGDERVGGPEV